MMEASVSLLLGLLAFCILSMDLCLSIVYRKLTHQTRAAALIVFTATSLGLVFFIILNSWSALTFSEGVYNILSYVWTGLLIADGAFLLSFVPYYTTWIIGHPYRNPYKTLFFLASVLFTGIAIADVVTDAPVLSQISFLICFTDIFFCVIVMIKNRKGIADRDVRILVLTTFIVAASLMPFVFAGLFFPLIRMISVPVFILAYAIVILVFLFLGINRLIHEKDGKKDIDLAQELERYHITDREMEVIELVGKGMTNKEIASVLSLSVNTVNNHIANIFSKTGVRSRIDLLNLIHKSLWLENGK